MTYVSVRPATAQVEASRCRLCGADRPAEPTLRIDDRFSIVRCRSCGLLSTEPELSDRDVLPHYPASYYGRSGRRFPSAVEGAIAAFRARRARLVERLSRTGAALDVGCGRGLILSELKARGWKVLGVELTESAAEGARSAGIPVQVGPAHALELDASSFDVAILWHVLEHVREPAVLLGKLAQALKQGGILLVAVPNAESWQARTGGAAWFHLDVPRHYHHFGLSVLRRALEEAGFEVARVSHFCLEQNLYGWIQTLLNRSGLPPNQLYDWLRSGEGRVAAALRNPWQLVWTTLLVPPVLIASALGFALETIARRGGTIEVVARRTGPAQPGGTGNGATAAPG